MLMKDRYTVLSYSALLVRRMAVVVNLWHAALVSCLWSLKTLKDSPCWFRVSDCSELKAFFYRLLVMWPRTSELTSLCFRVFFFIFKKKTNKGAGDNNSVDKLTWCNKDWVSCRMFNTLIGEFSNATWVLAANIKKGDQGEKLKAGWRWRKGLRRVHFEEKQNRGSLF